MSVSFREFKTKQLPFSLTKFPAGETHIQLSLQDIPESVDGFVINVEYEGNDDLINMALLHSALKCQYPDTPIALTMPYLPYARQDRQCSPGQAFSLEVIATIINSLNFNSVYVDDVHSKVSLQLIDRSIDRPQWLCAVNLGGKFSDTINVVSPDAGARDKTVAFARRFGFKNIVNMEKLRDPATGKLSGFDFKEGTSPSTESSTYLILDDICDAGGTFMGVAGRIREFDKDAKIYLYVTHGIFSKGLDVFKGTFEKIFTRNNISKLEHEILEVV